MRTVYKYQIPPRDRSSQPSEVIACPAGSKVLRVDEMGRDAFAWIEIDTTQPLGGLRIWLIGTGKEVPPGLKWLQTMVSESGYVWHVYVKAQNHPIFTAFDR